MACSGTQRIQMPKPFPFTLDELSRVFPTQLSQDLPLVEPNSGAFCETIPFQNIQWCDVDCDLLRQEFEVACYLAPEAMCYFLPAFIRCTGIDSEKMDLPLDYLLGMIAMTGNDAVRVEYKKKRWKLLTKDQANIVLKWIEWLKESIPVEDMIHLENAYNTVQQDNWNV